jgi:hypothetical protein
MPVRAARQQVGGVGYVITLKEILLKKGSLDVHANCYDYELEEE